MGRKLVIYNNCNVLGKWFKDNYEPLEEYTIFHISDDKEDIRGLSFDRVVLLDVTVREWDKDKINFILHHLRG